MFCSKCGTQVSDGAMFCSQCGNEVNISSNNITPYQNQEVVSSNTSRNERILEYLEYAKTLETNKHTLTQTINRLQQKINSLGIKNNYVEEKTNIKDFTTPFLAIAIIGALVALAIGFIPDIADAEYSVQVDCAHAAIGLAPFIPFLALAFGIFSFVRKAMLYQNNYQKLVDKDNARVAKEREQIISIKKQQNKLKDELAETEAIMEQLYSANVIYPKYRELVPIVTMWEYFDSGRCTELLGVNGAYNLYESESRQDIIISNLNQALSMLAQIRNTQYALYESIQESNYYAERMCSQTEQLIATNKNIERNSEIASYNAKVAADNSTISAYMNLYNF